MKLVLAPSVALLLLTSCASTGMANLTGATHSAKPTEAFSYAPAADGRVRVEIEAVQSHEDKDFIPTDPNWIQVKVRITNTGSRTINLTGSGERLADGSVLHDAQHGSDIVRPPSVGKTLLMSSGGIIGALIFPPAALIGVAADVAMPFMTAAKLERVAERLNREGLRGGPLAPGTSVSGLIFLPAVTGQTGLILFYDDAGKTQSLSIPRTL